MIFVLAILCIVFLLMSFIISSLLFFKMRKLDMELRFSSRKIPIQFEIERTERELKSALVISLLLSFVEIGICVWMVISKIL